ncbi:hypothetical protein ACI1TM_08590 [Lactococcus garvieae]|uniref:hypothetical protein n=1 Tax=Lactococcus garvieae TaxID=1363 RepID=UPI0038524F76
MNQKEIKAIKQEVIEKTALYVGYYNSLVADIIKEGGEHFLTSVFGSESGEALLQEAKQGKNAEVINIFVTEAVKQMTYSEFKKVAHNFFSFRQEDEKLLTKAIDPTQEFYHDLHEDPKAFLETHRPKEVDVFTDTPLSLETFQKRLSETSLYYPLDSSELPSLQVLTNQQLELLEEAQEEQLHSSREGMDQATYEVMELDYDVDEISYWVNDFKIGVENLRQIRSEKEHRLTLKKDTKTSPEREIKKAKGPQI